MQSIMSAFKRSADKKHKKLLQDSLLSSTDSSFTQDENNRPAEGLLPRLDSHKSQQLLHTPSPSKLSRRSATLRAEQPLQGLDNVGIMEVVSVCLATATSAGPSIDLTVYSCILMMTCCMQPLLSPKSSSSPVAAIQSRRERGINLSASKPPRKGQSSRLDRVSSPAYTPSRLRPNQDAARTPLTHSVRKHRGMKAAEERVLATELEHSALSTASDNVQASLHVLCTHQPSAPFSSLYAFNTIAGDCARQTTQ